MRKDSHRLIGLLFFIAILVVYIPAMKAGYIWDDPLHVTDNPLLRDFDGLKRIWFEPGAWAHYYPLTLTSFWVEYQIWGLDPIGYHLINVLLHAFNAILLWRILYFLQVPGALFAAAIFALHPVHVESVAWISERKNVLSGFFYLVALSIYLRLALRSNMFTGALMLPAENYLQDSRRYPKTLYILSIAFYLCALLSKTVTCSLPAVILILLWWQRARIGWRDVQALVPMFLVGLVLGINTIFMENHAGAQGPEWAFSFMDRCLFAGRALWFYASKLLWPANLSFIYPRWQIDSGVWWQYLYPLAALTAVVMLWILRGRLGKAPIAAVLIFGGTLLPALGFINFYPMRFSFVADHFQYLASISLIVLFASIATIVLQKYVNGKLYIGLVSRMMVLLVLGGLSHQQGHVYQDVGILYRDILSKNPNSWLAHNNLSAVLIERGEIDEAIAHAKEALTINPNSAEPYNNLGAAFHKQGKIDDAIANFLKSLQIEPDYADALNNLGAALLAQGMTGKAIGYFVKALHLKGEYAEAHSNLGAAMQRQGKIDDAIAHYREAIRIKPAYVDAHNNLGTALKEQGDIDNAIVHYTEAIRLNPDYIDAHNNLGVALQEQGSINAAIDHFLTVLRINPNYAKAHNNLAITLRQKNKIPLALKHFRKAVEIDPDYTTARDNLNRLLQQQARPIDQK